MIGIDTHVLVRYLVQDDRTQAAAANRAIEACTTDAPGFLSLVTLVETHWVLRHTYGLSAGDILDTIADLTEAEELAVEQPAVVHRALRQAASGTDFPDALIAQAAWQAGCTEVVTFDQKAATRVGFRLLET